VPRIPLVVHDMIYNQSIAKTNNPTFHPVQPPLRDTGAMALIPDKPHPNTGMPLGLADTPEPVPAAIDDFIQHDEGGGGMHYMYYQS
jgi:hypothetical protein